METRDLGLSPENRTFIVALTAVLVLIFGPIEPYGMVVRTLYLLGIPTLLWLLLRYWGTRWKIGSMTNDYITRTLFGCIAGSLIVGGFLSFTADYHSICGQYVQARDGQECVGDYVTVKGRDVLAALMQALGAVFAFWLGVSQRTD